MIEFTIINLSVGFLESIDFNLYLWGYGSNPFTKTFPVEIGLPRRIASLGGYKNVTLCLTVVLKTIGAGASGFYLLFAILTASFALLSKLLEFIYYILSFECSC